MWVGVKLLQSNIVFCYQKKEGKLSKKVELRQLKKNMKAFIRSVLRGLNPTDISERSGVDISIVVALSNSFNTGRELLAFLTQNPFLSSVFRQEDKNFIINIILSEGKADLEGKYVSLTQKIQTELEEKKITALRDIKEDEFLHWYAEKNDMQTGPNSILSTKLFIGGVPEATRG